MGQPVPVGSPRPELRGGVLRSRRAPVSVHLEAGVDPARGLEVLSLAEGALDRVQYDLRWPLPWPDDFRGGDAGLDVYVRASGPAWDAPVDTLQPGTPWDVASAFVTVRADLAPALLPRAVIEAVARAALRGMNAAQPETVVQALGATVATTAHGLSPPLDAWRAFQAEPWRALFGASTELQARGASLYLDRLLARHGDRSWTLLRFLVEGPVQHTPRRWPRLWDEPDLMDVARRASRGTDGGMDEALLEFAIARALLGTPGDPDDLVGALDRSLGSPPERAVTYGELPVYVTPREWLETTGSAAVRVDLSRAPVGAGMSLWVHANPYHRWLVSVVRVNPDGRVAGRWNSDVVNDGRWALRLELLDGFASAWVVLLDLGAADYDPDVPATRDGWWALHLAPAAAPSGSRGVDLRGLPLLAAGPER
ncbi:MAG: hypothetical protein HY909_24030 [Deltaproteobacteria bacterium]|nr:hypothetical protein [Deltaproteobacteria bacterium]